MGREMAVLGYFSGRGLSIWKTSGLKIDPGTGVQRCHLQGEPGRGGACGQVEMEMSAWYTLLLRCPLDRCPRRASGMWMWMDKLRIPAAGATPLGLQGGRGEVRARAALVMRPVESRGGEVTVESRGRENMSLVWGSVTMA